MSMDGASHLCSSLPLGPCPSHARKSYSPSLPLIGAQNLSVFAFHQTLSLLCKPGFHTHSHDISDLHAALLHRSIHRHVRSMSLGLSVHLQNDFSSPSSGKKHKPCVQKLTRGDFHQDQGFSDLVSEILKFMENSSRPELFPSRSELTRAGRSDLVDAILAKGGWMVAGWDMEPTIKEQAQKIDNSSIDCIAKATGEDDAECIRQFQRKEPTSLESNPLYLDVAELTTNSRSQQYTSNSPTQRKSRSHCCKQSNQPICPCRFNPRQEERVGESCWLIWSFNHGKEHREKPCVLATQEIQKKPPNVNGTVQSAGQVQDVPDGSRRDKALQLLAGESQHLEMTLGAPEGKKRRRRFPKKGSAGLPANQAVDVSSKRVYRREGWQKKSRAACLKSDERQQDEKSTDSVSHRIRGLEAELVSALDILKSERHALADDITSTQKQKVALTELKEVSDSLEFCETEVMNKKRELRTARAQWTALEGKLALDLMEFRRSLEEKDRLFEKTMHGLKMLRTVRIVWPNPASEVFLAGSYDGWTSWRRMEKSSAGVYVTALQLYPGQYEMKFIVNGEWRVDPNRPISWASGFENNVLMVV